jgi:hypothetical protein
LKIFETKGLILKLTEAQISGQQVEDIDDPLYGNMGGPEELELLREVYQDLQDSCEGLLQFLMETKTSLQGFSTLLFLSLTKTPHLPIELRVYCCSIMDQ